MWAPAGSAAVGSLRGGVRSRQGVPHQGMWRSFVLPPVPPTSAPTNCLAPLRAFFPGRPTSFYRAIRVGTKLNPAPALDHLSAKTSPAHHTRSSAQ